MEALCHLHNGFGYQEAGTPSECGLLRVRVEMDVDGLRASACHDRKKPSKGFYLHMNNECDPIGVP